MLFFWKKYPDPSFPTCTSIKEIINNNTHTLSSFKVDPRTALWDLLFRRIYFWQLLKTILVRFKLTRKAHAAMARSLLQLTLALTLQIAFGVVPLADVEATSRQGWKWSRMLRMLHPTDFA